MAYTCSEPPQEDDGHTARVAHLIEAANAQKSDIFWGTLTKAGGVPVEKREDVKWVLATHQQLGALGLPGQLTVFISDAYLFDGTVISLDGTTQVTELPAMLRISCFADVITDCTPLLPVDQEVIFLGRDFRNGIGLRAEPEICHGIYSAKEFSRTSPQGLAEAYRHGQRN